MNTAKLIQDIRDAFKDVPYPGDDNITRDHVWWESIEMTEDLKGKTWQEVDEETIISYKISLGRMTPQAFQHYVPAFLIAALNDVNDIGTFLFQMLVPDDERSYAYYFPLIDILDEKQKAVTRQFIQWFRSDASLYRSDGIEKIRQFWGIDD